MNRRSMLRAVATLPLAGKMVAEEATKALAGIVTPGASSGAKLGGGFAYSEACAPAQMPTSQQVSKLFMDAAFRSEAESAAYANNRNVSYIDVDLASKKSFSLAAKVTFQRQRNVQRELERHMTDHVSVWSLIQKRMNPFG